MKLYFPIITSLLILISCSPKKDNKTSDSNNLGIKTDTTDNIATHIVDVQCGGEFVPLRNRMLSKNELRISQKGDDVAKALNDEVIIDKLYNRQRVKLIKQDTLGYHFVEVIDDYMDRGYLHSSSLDDKITQGFIIAKFCMKPTLRKLEKINIPEFNSTVQAKNTIGFLEYHTPDGDLLDYAFAYVTPEADYVQVLTFSIASINQFYYKLYMVNLQNDHLLFDGYAELNNYYEDDNGKKISRFLADEFMGHKIEIHMSEDKKSAFLKIEETFDKNFPTAPRDGSEEVIFGEKVVMKRIK